jgi:hypothetical protein
MRTMVNSFVALCGCIRGQTDTHEAIGVDAMQAGGETARRRDGVAVVSKTAVSTAYRWIPSQKAWVFLPERRRVAQSGHGQEAAADA